MLTLAGSDVITDGEIGPPAGSGLTDVSSALGFNDDQVYKFGHAAETITESVGELIGYAGSSQPVVIMLDSSTPLAVGTDDTRELLAAFAQAGNYIFVLRDSSAQALVPGDTTSPSALVFANQQSQVAAIYSDDDTNPDIALAALMSSQNLDNAASIITPHAKALPGAKPTDINSTQLSELERKRTNVYTLLGGQPTFLGGYTGRSGHWLDAVWWLLWTKSRLENAVWTAQRSSRRLNSVLLDNALTEVMLTGVRNGGIEGGRKLSSSTQQDIITTTGNNNFDGVLTNGYLVWVEPISSRTATDVESRVGRFKIWATGSEAIHEVFGDLVFTN